MSPDVTWWANPGAFWRLTSLLLLLADVPSAAPSTPDSMTSRTVDIKLSFDPYDCTPGPMCRVFRRNLLQLGAKTDAQGYSFADCFLRPLLRSRADCLDRNSRDVQEFLQQCAESDLQCATPVNRQICKR